MNSSKIESGNDSSDGNSSNNQLLRDIEAISKALYLQKPPRKTLISPYDHRSKSVERIRFTEPKSIQNSRILNEIASHMDKKSSLLWKWKKPLKALAHMRQRRFNICFCLHVHSIEGLPTNFNDISLQVYWKRKDEVLGTRSSRVLQSTAEFEETLMHKCSVYGSRSGAHNSAKYEVKLSLIYASVVGAPGVDIGKHWVDLTRLLPLTLEELEGEKSAGKWITSFKLAGKAKGASLNVSFCFLVMKDNLVESKNSMNVAELINLTQNRSTTMESVTSFEMNNDNKMLRRVGSVPRNLDHRSVLSSTSYDVKVYQEVLPILGLELSKSTRFLYETLNEANMHCPEEFDLFSEHVEPPNKNFESAKDISDSDCEYAEFTVVEKGIQMSEKGQLEPVHTIDGYAVETINVDEIIKDDNIDLEEEMECNSKANTCGRYIDEIPVNDIVKHEESTVCTTGSTMEELDLTFDGILISELSDLESPLAIDEILEQKNYMDIKSNYKAGKISKASLSLDDATELVASDFLNMLGLEHASSGLSFDGDPESPRERLLREFEKEALTSGSLILGFDSREYQGEFSCNAPTGSGCQGSYDDFDLFPVTQGSKEQHRGACQLLKDRRKANILEDLETEYLMKEWGLNESAFQLSQRYCSDGFGSPVELPPEDPLELPPLGDGFGHFIVTKDGGYLRSINPSLFRNARNVGNLVMQVSRPVVLPAEMGSEITEILRHLASVGIKKLSMQVNQLMPLEDITGKTLQEVAARTMVLDRQTALHHRSTFDHDSFAGKEEDEELLFGRSYDSMCSGLNGGEISSGCVSLRDFACLAMDRIEALSIEGLRIQCGMSNEDAPSCIRCHSVGKSSTFEWKYAYFVRSQSSEAGVELLLPDVRDDADDVDELMDLSITLDEWLKLDNGIIKDEDQISRRRLKILVAHHAKSIDLVTGTLTGHINFDHASGKTPSLLGNNLTVAFMVLLRDPIRNYEPVGTSMLALFQVERFFVPAKPIMYGKMSDKYEEKDDEACIKAEVSDERKEEKEEEKESIPWFKFSEVHLAGLNTELGKNQLWGNKTQQQSGTRWLLASGMAKSNKHTLSKSNAIVISNRQGTRKVWNEDVLWSITSNIQDTGTKWKELAAFVPYIRNPDVVFLSESTKSHVACNT